MEIDGRRRGFIENPEPRPFKIFWCTIHIVFAIANLILGAILLSRGANADRIQYDFQIMNGITQTMSPYDTCAAPSYEVDPRLDPTFVHDAGAAMVRYCNEAPGLCLSTGTNWHYAFKYSGTVLTLMAFNFVLMAIGAFRFLPRCLGYFINCIIAGPSLGAAIVAIVSSNSALGANCWINVAPSEYLGDREWSSNWTY